MPEALCGTSWIRTSDTRIFSPLLYQLSYGTPFLSTKANACCFGNANVVPFLEF